MQCSLLSTSVQWALFFAGETNISVIHTMYISGSLNFNKLSPGEKQQTAAAWKPNEERGAVLIKRNGGEAKLVIAQPIIRNT